MMAFPAFPDICSPFHLLEIVFQNGRVFYFTSRGADEFEFGQTFVSWNFDIDYFSSDPSGIPLGATVRLDNVDRLFGVEVLINSTKNCKIKAWIDYDHWDGVRGPYLMLDGWADGATIDEDNVIINIMDSDLVQTTYPRVVADSQFFSEDMTPGSEITFEWNNVTLILKRRL